jgi:hypothetical protein
MAALETWLLDNNITDVHEKALCSRAWLAALYEVALNSSHNRQNTPSLPEVMEPTLEPQYHKNGGFDFYFG